MNTIKRFRTASIIVATAIAGFAFTATSAKAAPVATLTSEARNGEPHAGPLISAATGDLLETVGSVAAEGGNGDGVRQNTSTLFDGSISTGVANGAQTAANAAGYWGDNHFIEFDLDTTTNAQGYDISLIQVIQSGDGFRGGINVAISVQPVGGSYTPLIAPDDAGTPSNVNMYAITDDSAPLIASGIDGVRFDFTNTATGSLSGWTWFREIDVIGEPAGTRLPFTITEIVHTPDAVPDPTVTLTWRKTGAPSYIARFSPDMSEWDSDLDDSITLDRDENQGDVDHMTVTFPLTGDEANATEIFFRIEEQ